jgi:GNAT superfamily N-acetyltransferase
VIRDFRHEDAPGVVALRREAEPTYVGTAATLLHRHRALPQAAQLRAWVAANGADVTAYASAVRPWDTSDSTVGEFGVLVAPRARRRGIGADLYERAVAHLRVVGARTAGVWARPEGVSFLERRAHEHRRSSWQSALDLREADLTELVPLEGRKAREGFHVVPLREVLDRPRDLYELDVATSRDEPSDYPIDAMEYDDWVRTTYEHPGIDHEGSRVVVAGDRLVAWALIDTDGHGRGMNAFTGTHPEFRGRGLARLAKLAVAAWARGSGVDVLFTGNDASNAPMLAINRRMGYRPVAELHYLVRKL